MLVCYFKVVFEAQEYSRKEERGTKQMTLRMVCVVCAVKEELCWFSVWRVLVVCSMEVVSKPREYGRKEEMERR